MTKIESIRKKINSAKNYSNEFIEKISNELLKTASESNSFPVQIDNILKELDFKVCKIEMNERIGGLIIIGNKLIKNYDADKIIAVRKEEIEEQQRFIMAHELAHYLFDYEKEKIKYTNDEEKSELEVQAEGLEYADLYMKDHHTGIIKEIRANLFAANLLMPRKIFEREYNKNLGNPDFYETLRKFFGVKKEAVEKRIYELGLPPV